MKAPREMREGPDAARRFESTLARVLTVSKEELTRRDATWKKAKSAKKARSKKSPA